MSTVAFPTGYYLSRASVFKHAQSAAVDIMSDGTPRTRTLTASYFVTVSCLFEHLTAGEAGLLRAWLVVNAANTITWTIDSLNLSGVIVGGHSATMTGPLFSVSFEYYAQVLI